MNLILLFDLVRFGCNSRWFGFDWLGLGWQMFEIASKFNRCERCGQKWHASHFITQIFAFELKNVSFIAHWLAGWLGLQSLLFCLWLWSSCCVGFFARACVSVWLFSQLLLAIFCICFAELLESLCTLRSSDVCNLLANNPHCEYTAYMCIYYVYLVFICTFHISHS